MLTSFLSYLSSISHNALVQELIVAILEASPDQLKHFLPQMIHSLMPRATSKWVNAVRFLCRVSLLIVVNSWCLFKWFWKFNLICLFCKLRFQLYRSLDHKSHHVIAVWHHQMQHHRMISCASVQVSVQYQEHVLVLWLWLQICNHLISITIS